MAEQKRKEPTFYRVLHRTDKFNPGEHIELERSVEFDRWNVDRSDLAELVKLPLQELQAKRKDGATAEKTIFGKVQVAAEEWVEQAAQTMLLDRAIEYVKTPEVKHTSNEWKRQKDGVWEISNRVYIMRYIQAEIDALTGQRRELYPLRRAGTEGAEAEIDAINDRLRALRRELKLCARIENDAPTVRANVGADRSETHEKTDKSRPDRHPPSGGRVPADRGR